MASIFEVLDQAQRTIAKARAQAETNAAHHAHAAKQWLSLVDSLRDERTDMAATIARMEREANVRAAK